MVPTALQNDRQDRNCIEHTDEIDFHRLNQLVVRVNHETSAELMIFR